MIMEHINEVNYCLQEAYKMAVREMGITDWSLEPIETRDKVATLQVEIAKMIQYALTESKRTKKL